MKILFVCKDRNNGHYDGKFGLWNSASFVSKTINEYKYLSKLVSVIDGNGIDKEIYAYDPDIIILEALWVTPEKVTELTNKYPNKRFICRIHSKTPFLSNEGIAFDWMNKYSEIPSMKLAGNNSEFVYDMARVGYNLVYLPNIYKRPPRTYSNNYDKYMVDIGCFGSLRPMKNHVEQAVAAIRFANGIGKKLNFHINSSRKEQNGENILKNLRALFANQSRHWLVEHSWMPHDEFLFLGGQMDIGMQVSLSESFNIVTADLISQDVPVVTSKEIKFVSYPFKADPTDTDQIVWALYNAYYAKYLGLHRINSVLLDIDITNSTETWLQYLER